jgi:hypothetical protein
LSRNCLLQQVVEGKIKGGIEMTERQGRRRKKLLDDIKETRGYSRSISQGVGELAWEEVLDLS